MSLEKSIRKCNTDEACKLPKSAFYHNFDRLCAVVMRLSVRPRFFLKAVINQPSCWIMRFELFDPISDLLEPVRRPGIENKPWFYSAIRSNEKSLAHTGVGSIRSVHLALKWQKQIAAR